MSDERKTIQDWAAHDGFEVLDPDGFDRTDPDLMTRTFTREEWERGWPSCTIQCVRGGREYAGTPAYSAPEMIPLGWWALPKEEAKQ